MDLDIYQVDAFTLQPFKGNPAAVCITQAPLDVSLMQSVANEMALSETAFLSLDDWRLRWFTPDTEVALCGHGTLATAHVLRQQGLLTPGTSVVFHTLSGPLIVTAEKSQLTMDFPRATLDYQVPLPPTLLQALSLKPADVIASAAFGQKLLLELTEEATVVALTPDFTALKNIPGRGIVVTAIAGRRPEDFVSRYFAPWVGVNEDPVTGSAHCALAVYWGQKLGLETMTGYQASVRGGVVRMQLQAHGRVTLSGDAVTILQGTMTV
ncbi:PhzF family phenazine biosynthesis protein [Shewanella yunxiaonensis]|uniref:PhzF family phenazine biosynthesis protein n=1 Tax=Shewanella yunxiaonensis TaxID=2829809 RepID=A0ABX7YSB7_9GAMM|nr:MULTISPECIES: PhzF family phenazine biosynthesis protein [Shewanella]MDF0534203.1 PhzF family phenazine biosynthesis protein [Shewanella sp. A32]QUN05542.1 PhzF family phenazine biosynthesis protein [Shewanella yunxiaonensis]